PVARATPQGPPQDSQDAEHSEAIDESVPASGARRRPGPGLLVGLIGLLCVLLSLFALNWADAAHGAFLDLSKAARAAGGDRYPYETAYLYAVWAGFALFGLSVVLTLLAGLPFPRNAVGNSYSRIVGAVVAGGAAVLQTVTIVEVFAGPASPQAGA